MTLGHCLINSLGTTCHAIRHITHVMWGIKLLTTGQTSADHEYLAHGWANVSRAEPSVQPPLGKRLWFAPT